LPQGKGNERVYTKDEVMRIIDNDRKRVADECAKDSLWYDTKDLNEFPPDLTL